MTSEEILALTNPLVCGVFAATFFFLWRRDRSAVWIAIIGITYLARMIGFAIFHFTPDPNGVLSVTVMHLFYAVSAITLVWGICLRSGQKAHLRTYIAIAFIGLALMAAASYGEDYNARLYIANACYGLILALGCLNASRKKDRDFIDQAIIAQLIFGAFQFYTRPMIAVMVEGSMSAEEYRGTPFYAVMVITVALASLLMAMTLILAALTDQMKALRVEAHRDPLTGLPTRGPFEEAALAMLERSYQDDVAVAVVVIDVDHFKAVNDTFGHQLGDRALAAVGQVISRQTRTGDLSGRIGGEEFCLIAWDCDLPAGEAIALRIRDALAQSEIAGLPADLRITASFGVAQRTGSEGYVKVFARADAALFAAKKAGRNCVRTSGQPDNLALFKAPAGLVASNA